METGANQTEIIEMWESKKYEWEVVLMKIQGALKRCYLCLHEGGEGLFGDIGN